MCTRGLVFLHSIEETRSIGGELFIVRQQATTEEGISQRGGFCVERFGRFFCGLEYWHIYSRLYTLSTQSLMEQ